MRTTNIAQYARNTYTASLDEQLGRHYISISTYDGEEVRAWVAGDPYGYVSLADAQHVYTAEVAQIDAMLTAQGR